VDQILKVLGFTQNLCFVNAVTARADERALDVSSEGFSTILRIVGSSRRTKGGKDLLSNH
jgi:hypothetical protein